MKKIAFTNSFLTKRNRKESVLTIELSITGEDFSDLSILPELYSEINSLASRLSEITNGDLGKRK
ncbi:hypothetical protein J0M99_03730 [Listeria monocytogenes]|uniref:hypothetical protein n=1 Tax=Listeria monocytogenes TaxID=1639 RepID=UPI0010B9F4EA|nr:hypothetical protein [Listeria monocytogenes]EAC6655790.1 hypothetical protein [Listeria monocytogenes]EAD6050136.1 hypothetical protein [Listeria monocytogenes]EAD6071717.1 hypothetical protein [Listeria monocytogenes]EAD6080791.1 hypothetical protein [Listeria monocytogenes]EAD6105340.1 hypothetical protein [Listeria monocytogenes]